jgi:sulfur-oxidizing protein SoxY
MQLRWTSVVISFASAMVLAASAFANEKAEPDPAQSTYWEPIRKIMFGDREILDGKDVLRVYLPLRADDASTVPVTVKAQIDQKADHYLKTIYLVVERNPSPTAGVFHFSLDSGRVQLETRLRFEDFSHVRAIGETSDGKLYMSSRWVKAAGGCSAPNARNYVPPALMGKMKFKFEDETLKYDEPALVQLMIRHPNESALAGDFDPSKVARFVRNVSVTYAGKDRDDGRGRLLDQREPQFPLHVCAARGRRTARGSRGHVRSTLHADAHGQRRTEAARAVEACPTGASIDRPGPIR